MTFLKKFVAIAALAVAPLAANAVDIPIGSILPADFDQTGTGSQSVCVNCAGVTNFDTFFSFNVEGPGIINVSASATSTPNGGGTYVFNYTIFRPDASVLVTGTTGDNSSIPSDAFVNLGIYRMRVYGSFTANQPSSANYSMTITSAPKVPEPGSLALLGLGLIGLGAARRRKA